MTDGAPITVACCLWATNAHSFAASSMYDESWVEKLYRGFKRHLVRPMRFVCFVDKLREFSEPIEQELIGQDEPDYSAMMEPYRLDAPMILTGLDTVVVGNCDEMADYCFYGDRVAVPIDPFYPDKVCNGVALVPAGMKARFYDAHSGENDMEWIRAQNVETIDRLFPGQVLSFKGSVRKHGLQDARIVYFHGEMKPHQLQHVGWIKRFWV